MKKHEPREAIGWAVFNEKGQRNTPIVLTKKLAKDMADLHADGWKNLKKKGWKIQAVLQIPLNGEELKKTIQFMGFSMKGLKKGVVDPSKR